MIKIQIPYLAPLDKRIETCITIMLVFFSLSLQFYWILKYTNENKNMKNILFLIVVIAFLWAYLRSTHL